MGGDRMKIPEQKQKITPNKLKPPVEASLRIMEKDKEREPANHIKRFVKKFFLGDGY